MDRFIALIVFIGISMSVFSQRQKVILDCDLGDDIDDAYAVALLLASSDKFEILGITTDYGRTEDRAKLACKMLYVTGLDSIPVYFGRNTSASSERANWFADQYYWSDNFDKLKPKKEKASDFIIEQLHKYPNEIILFTVGPVTNMLDIIAKDPNALKLAKSIVSMFGSFYVGYNGAPTIIPEWNVKCDIDAAKKFASCGAKITYIGLDITSFVKWDKEHQNALLYRQSPLTNALSALKVLWSVDNTPTLFDAVAIGFVLYPELFKTVDAHVYVDDEGYTRIDSSQPPNCKIGVDIDKEKFNSNILEVYLRQQLER